MLIFNFYGHENIRSTHRNTIEFTKDEYLTPKGDCILGIKADFDYKKLREIVKKYSRINISITVGNIKDEFTAEVNKGFDSPHEIVIRKSDFASGRTLGINADKSAFHIERKLVEKLKDPKSKGKVAIKGIE